MKAIQLKYVAVVGLLVLGLANHSFAVDAAEAAGVMADLEYLVSEAKLTLSEASLKDDGDRVSAIEEADKRSAAIDDAVEAGRAALSAMEQAIAKGDVAAAESAEDNLAAALVKARDGLAGILPAAVAASPTKKSNKSKSESDDDDSEEKGKPTNIYDVPWKSQGIRAYYESLYGPFHDASGFGQGKGFGDRDFGDGDATKK